MGFDGLIVGGRRKTLEGLESSLDQRTGTETMRKDIHSVRYGRNRYWEQGTGVEGLPGCTLTDKDHNEGK